MKKKIKLSLVTMVLVAALAACGSRLSGTYESQTDGSVFATIRFDGGKCYMGMATGLAAQPTIETGYDYRINDGKLFLSQGATETEWGKIEIKGSSITLGSTEYKKVK